MLLVRIPHERITDDVLAYTVQFILVSHDMLEIIALP